MREQAVSYSIDFLLKTAFEYELLNNIRLNKEPDDDLKKVIAYLEKRIKEIKERYSQ